MSAMRINCGFDGKIVSKGHIGMRDERTDDLFLSKVWAKVFEIFIIYIFLPQEYKKRMCILSKRF